eukprot:m.156514 g.156514  ORF g.156514 m.156514 type:complete len:893 (-) comp17562_c0_seq3:253-2931(-)
MAVAVVETYIELGKFVNIELFHRGHYCVKARLAQLQVAVPTGSGSNIATAATAAKRVAASSVGLKVAGVVLEANERYAAIGRLKTDGDGRWVGQGEVDAGETTLCSAPFKIAYKREYVHLDTSMRVSLTIPFDSESIVQTLASLSGVVAIELWFNAKEDEKLRLVATRSIRLNGLAAPGVYTAQATEFDFYHTCAVQVSVHSQFVGFDFGLETQLGPGCDAEPQESTSPETGLILVNRWGATAPTSPTKLLFGHLPACMAQVSTSEESLLKKLGMECSTEKEALEDIAWHPAVESHLRYLCGFLHDSIHVASVALSHVGPVPVPSENEFQHALSDVAQANTVEQAADAVLAALVALSEKLLRTWTEFHTLGAFQQSLFRALQDLSLNQQHERLVHGYYVSHAPVDAEPSDTLLPDGIDHAAAAHKMRLSNFFSSLPQPRAACVEGSDDPRTCPVIFEERWWPSEGPGPGHRAVAFQEDDDLDAVDLDESLGLGSWAGGRTGGEASGTSVASEFRDESVSETATEGVQGDTAALGSCVESGNAAASSAATSSPVVDIPRALAPRLLPHPEPLSRLRDELGSTLGVNGAFFWDVEPQRCHHKKAVVNSGWDHLIVFVHGLSGNQYDLRLLRLRLEMAFPGLKYLMSQANQDDTHIGFEAMTDNFVQELKPALQLANPARVSFIGHSLGSVVIRSALARPDVKELFECRPSEGAARSSEQWSDTPRKPTLWTYASLSGPHLGSLYLNGLISTGMWLFSRWKRSQTLRELGFVDAADPHECFMYKLSKAQELRQFRNVLLIASPQDRYVPTHSALLLPCCEADNDPKFGPMYKEMWSNIVEPLFADPSVRVARIRVLSAVNGRSLNTMIGRAAHIAMLEDPLFVNKFVACAGHYFE